MPAKYFSQLFPKPGKNVSTLLCTLILTLVGNLLVALERLHDAALGIPEGELVYPVTAHINITISLSWRLFSMSGQGKYIFWRLCYTIYEG